MRWHLKPQSRFAGFFVTIKHMIDIKYIRDHKEEVKKNILLRGIDPAKADVEKLLELDKKRSELMYTSQNLQSQRNQFNEKIKQSKKPSPEEIATGKKIKEEISKLEDQLKDVTDKWQELMDWMPNIVSPQMPIGKDASGDVEISSWPKSNPRPKHNFTAKHYHDLMVELDLVDMEKASKNSGSRFYYLKNDAVLLQFSLFNHALKKLVSRGFTPITTPDLVKYRPLYGTGYFPSESSAIYKMYDPEKTEDKEALFLVGTSEQAIVAYHSDEVITIDDDHPLRYVGYSECFRSEAGSWGKDTKGIKRVHQFAKVEMIFFTTPETSEKYMQEAQQVEEELLQDLNLPYHVIDMCTGDVGMATYRKFDTEVWLPSQQEYCETMSNSDLGAYHSRRLNIKYLDRKSGQKRFVHTISSTAITNTRPILAIVDNFQNSDGSVTIPEVLRPYMGKDTITK